MRPDRARPHRIAIPFVLAVVAAAAGCSGEPRPLTATVDPGVLGTAEWERVFDPSEFDSYRTGTVQLLQGGGETADPPAVAGQPAIRPAAGATVELFASAPHYGLPLVPVASTVADAEGRFRVGPGPATGWVLRATAARHAPVYGGAASRVPGIVQLQDGHLELGVLPSFDLVGSLRNAVDGPPLAGETLLIETLGFFAEAVTDEDGRFQASVPMGPVSIFGRRPSLAALLAFVPRDQSSVDIVAPHYEPIRGTVVDARTERRVAGAVVIHMLQPWLHTVTDENGHFELVAPRFGRVGAFAEGFGWRSVRLPVAGDVDVRVVAPRRVTGRVVDEHGAPVADARIHAAARNEGRSIERMVGPLTDADGRFDLSWLPEPWVDAESHPVIAAHRRGLGYSAGVTVEADLDDVELVLAGERSVRGVVQRASGAHVVHVPVDMRWTAAGLTDHEALALGVPTARLAVTSAAGEFESHRLPAGVSGEATFEIEGTRFVREFGASGDLLFDIRLAPGRPIAGHVVDVAGERVVRPGVVTARGWSGAGFDRLERTVEIESDGTFRIAELPAGKYTIFANVRGYEVLSTTIDAGDESVVLRASRPASLLVDVVFPAGVEPVPAIVLLRSLADPAADVRREDVAVDDDQRRARFRVVRRGRYEVSVRAGLYGGRIEELDVPDGERPPVTVELTQRSLLHAVVLTSAGDPVSGQLIRARRVSGGVPQNFVTGEDGRARLIGLEAGEWRARVMRIGVPAVEARFRLPDDSDELLELRIPAHGALDVQFESPPGDGVIVGLERADGSACYAWAEGGDFQNARFRLEEGRSALRLEGVPAGRVTVTVQREGADRERRVVEVEDGETVRAEFD